MKLKKIRLSELSSATLNESEMCKILGGANCQCGCHYATSGGSSTSDNNSANTKGGLTSDPSTTLGPNPIRLHTPGGAYSSCNPLPVDNCHP